jgi:hypothetical protein
VKERLLDFVSPLFTEAVAELFRITLIVIGGKHSFDNACQAMSVEWLL